ncbi:DapH/DapD/GlmU-related protein [Collinsella sp. HCP28S3_E9]|uniref:DapH/DapD/GlmU-related protein n=1 Tax=Collinsella sp. HCP28S3_E9 TaxID=3438924 RepID=UPI003F8C21FF
MSAIEPHKHTARNSYTYSTVILIIPNGPPRMECPCTYWTTTTLCPKFQAWSNPRSAQGCSIPTHSLYDVRSFLRGKPRFSYGKGFTTGYGCRIEAFGDGRQDKTIRTEIVENCHLGDNVHIVATNHVTISKNFLSASKVFISDCGHGEYSGPNPSHPDTDPSKRALASMPVIIGDNVWLGENVCALKGVHIGDGAIIGANAVVSKDIPANSIAVGSPAKVIKQ